MADLVYPTEVAQRFWANVDRSGGEAACWEWTRKRLPNGYGHVKITQRHTYAHRVAWELASGRITNGLYVLHRCDNPPCCNPAHLFLGTASDNARDREAKGRGAVKKGQPLPWTAGGAHGTDYSNAKLNDAAVREIRGRYRAGGVTQSALAAEYGVHQSIVSEVVNGKGWAHVGDER